jgi:tellurite resistance protein TerC
MVRAFASSSFAEAGLAEAEAGAGFAAGGAASAGVPPAGEAAANRGPARIKAQAKRVGRKKRRRLVVVGTGRTQAIEPGLSKPPSRRRGRRHIGKRPPVFHRTTRRLRVGTGGGQTPNPMPSFLAILDTMPLWVWAAFFLFIAAMLALDLGVFQRHVHEVKMKEALGWCVAWLMLALAFGALVWRWLGREPAQQYIASYLVELCLSIDNIFVFILIFSFFKVERQYQHRVLFWGIIGAVLLRVLFILVGVSVIERFHWVLYLFGAFLVYTGVKMALPQKAGTKIDPEHNTAVRLFRRFFPVAEKFDGGHFITVENGRRVATPLLLVLIVVETTDIVFALDSLPAVLAITRDSFVALTSNVFAILGLRSLYFALSGVMQLFRYLKIGLSVVLVFIGVKMLIEPWVDVTIGMSLGVIGGVLGVSILFSILLPEKSRRQ